MNEVNKNSGNIVLIKEYFGGDGYPEVTMEELKALSKEDREELGDLIRATM